MPEYSHGAHKVRVTLVDGRQYSAIFIAWADEIVKVGTGTVIPFDAEQIIGIENDLS
jgi:hypothetical protein